MAIVAATALAHVLVLSTPRPLVFFWWIIGLATLVVVLYPFSTAAPLSGKAAIAVVELVIGIAIGSLVSGVDERSARSWPSPGGRRSRCAVTGGSPCSGWVIC